MTPVPNPLNYLDITSRTAYIDDVGWLHVVYEITNNGDRNIGWIRVQVTIYDNEGNVLNSKTIWPSPYPDYGLPAGQSFSHETLFEPRPDFGKYSIKIVDAEFS